MKKFLIVLIGILLLAGLSGCAKREATSVPSIKAMKFEYEGHQYIYFRKVPGHSGGPVHDPNCWCMIDYD